MRSESRRRWLRRPRWSAAARPLFGIGLWSLAALGVGACIATAPTGIERQTDADGGAGGGFETTNTATTSTGLGGESNDPHAVLGADPPHGPFKGGNRVVIVGNGYDADVTVWFGDTLAEDIVAIDPNHIQVTAPAHAPGEVDLTTQNGDDESTRRTLPAGYTYDALYADPDTGPVAGGTVITIVGVDTEWDQPFEEARVDQKPCTTVDVLGPTELRCTVPQGTPGAKSISVATTAETVTALDAYTYADSTDGFKGGLSGDPIAGNLKVLVYNNFSGDFIPAAYVVVGSDISTALVQQTDANGVTVFDDPSLDEPRTVTVAALCHSPITFVDVPVDTVTVYLDPVLSPACAAEIGEIPPGGGNPVNAAFIQGELRWPGAQEFQKGDWDNVPAPLGPEEQRVAYIFFATSNVNQTFSVPSTTYTVTEQSPGELGYGFSVPTIPGNRAMYAVAGILDDETDTFTAYAFGAIGGVSALPGETTENVVIEMNHALDQALTMEVSPPPPGPKGPDRLDASVVVELSDSRYAILPGMRKTPLIPLNGDLNFIGLPPLDDDLTGLRYLSRARAVTGPQLGAPLSVVAGASTTSTSITIDVSGFVSVPQLTAPAGSSLWNGSDLAVSYVSGGFPVDLTVYEITAGGGLWRWLVAAPYGDHSTAVPDLSGFEMAHLPDGPLVIGVYGARIDEFDYGQLAYRNLRPAGMDAYALDFFNVYK